MRKVGRLGISIIHNVLYGSPIQMHAWVNLNLNWQSFYVHFYVLFWEAVTSPHGIAVCWFIITNPLGWKWSQFGANFNSIVISTHFIGKYWVLLETTIRWCFSTSNKGRISNFLAKSNLYSNYLPIFDLKQYWISSQPVLLSFTKQYFSHKSLFCPKLWIIEKTVLTAKAKTEKNNLYLCHS